MRLIIAGSRTLNPSFEFILGCFKMFNLSELQEVVSGACPTGVDGEGEHFASHMNVEVIRFPADWDKYGKAAGPIRNKEMAKYSDVLLLIWDGESRGSLNMKQEMLKLNKPVYEVVLIDHTKD